MFPVVAEGLFLLIMPLTVYSLKLRPDQVNTERRKRHPMKCLA